MERKLLLKMIFFYNCLLNTKKEAPDLREKWTCKIACENISIKQSILNKVILVMDNKKAETNIKILFNI